MKYDINDYIGKEFSYLTVVELVESGRYPKWKFKCKCGNYVIRSPYKVINSNRSIMTCGCLSRPVGYTKVNKNDYIGKTYKDLTVIDVVRRPEHKQAELKCLCSCGNISYVYPSIFNKGGYNSCGCKRDKFKATHSGSKHPLYKEWLSMVSRCNNENSYNYKDYGARGITVCEEWLNPLNFYAWVESIGGKPYKATLDRIDNNKGYSPSNCRYASMHEQSRNKRSNIMITYNDKTQCLQDWANELGINPETLRHRYHRGLPIDEVLSTKLSNKGRYKRKKS